jgi:hypothetical protein
MTSKAASKITMDLEVPAKLRLKQATRFRVGVTSFDLDEGRVVTVKAKSPMTQKLLIRFDESLVDWFSIERIKRDFQLCASQS